MSQRTSRRRVRRARRAAALVELALVLPLLLLLLLGVWEVGRLLEVRHFLASSAREAARLAAARPTSAADVVQAARDALTANGLPGEMAEVRLTDATGATADPAKAASGELLNVEVNLAFRHARYTTLKLIASDGTRVTARAAWCLHRESD